MNKKISFPIAIIIIIVLTGLVIGGVLAYQYWWAPEEEIEEISPEDETADWKTYSYKNDKKEYEFEFKYPDIITISRDYGLWIDMVHSVPFEHDDPCDFKGDASPLEKLIDFKITIYVIERNLIEAMCSAPYDYEVDCSSYIIDNEVKPDPGYVDEIAINSLHGYRITTGVEGCGRYEYYFSLNPEVTLVIWRSFIAEFNPAATTLAEEYLKIPGIITPEKEEELFNQMLSTFKFIEKEIKELSLEEMVYENSKIYRDRNYSLEIICPNKDVCFLGEKNQKISILSSKIDSIKDYFIEELSIEFKVGSNNNCEKSTISMATGPEGKKIVSENLTEQGWPETLKINNLNFYRHFSSQSAMGGKSIVEYGYKTFHDDICYEIILVSKGANNVESGKIIREEIFFPILSSFKFIE